MKSRSAYQSLDDYWLDFVKDTLPLFENYPFMVPVRQLMFKTMVADPKVVGWNEGVKTIARAMLRRAHSTIVSESLDVLFWVDSHRDVLNESQLLIYRYLKEIGMNAGFAVSASISDRFSIPIPQIIYRVPSHLALQRRWQEAWDSFSHTDSVHISPGQESQFRLLGRLADSNEEELLYVLQKLRPKVIVLASDHLLPSSSVCYAAKQLDIPTVVIQHGTVQAFYTPIASEQMVLWGQVSYEKMRELGAPSQRLHVLGSPRHDRLEWRHDPDVGKTFRDVLGLTDKPVFVFFSNGNDYVRNGVQVLEACAEWLEIAAQELKDEVQFLVRLHPNEDERLYADKHHLRLFKSECDVWLTLAGADVVGSLCSTALIEGLLYQKPILQFYADDWPVLADNWQRNLAMRVESPITLVNTLRTLSHAKYEEGMPSQQHAMESVFANQGHAIETVGEYIASFAGGV